MSLLLGAADLVVFVDYEEYVAAEPVIRTSVFQNKCNYIRTVLHGIILSCLLYLYPSILYVSR